MIKRMKSLTLFSGLMLSAFAGTATAAPVLMSAEWAAQACEAFNKNPKLTDGLGGKWIGNNKGRGYKVIHLYRSDCENSPQVEMRISDKNGKALCTYGGKIEMAKLDSGADYLMYATTEKWHEMGAGEYGPMKAMMFGRLQFQGPKWEAMSVMTPFEQFLLLAGQVPSTETSCPK
ncbi:SCP2 sterol-binding domain-containing protein [Sulfuriferula sp. AH1]|uniref:SCP2 sterol-binding domain-containing protein n=1 Tax=Sulfuriferula sp. AH1 TaxID=1985873 RepID=UPI001CB8F034|nr:SCP2 sterol-binding domain-containing protein [Sulfuriferula sp. AH1]